MKLLTGILYLVLFSCLYPISAAATEAPLKKVILAYSSYSPSALWFLLEKELKFFRGEGIALEPVFIRGAGALGVKGLMAGNFDYINSTASVMDAIIRARQPLRVIFTTGTVHFWVVARPEIRSILDLKGKIIGISALGSNPHLAIQEILKRHGLDPLKDTTFLVIGSSRDRFTALTSGSVHATLLSPPFNLKAQKMGYQKLASASDYVRWPQAGLGTREERLHKDPEEAAKMLRASLKGLRFMLAQREYVISKAMQMFNITHEEALETYELLKDEITPAGYLGDEAERQAISVIRQAAKIGEDIAPERVFDNRFVREAERELKTWVPQMPR